MTPTVAVGSFDVPAPGSETRGFDAGETSGEGGRTLGEGGWHDSADATGAHGRDRGDAQADAWIPANLDTMDPGPLLAAMLSQIDTHRLSGHDRVVVLRARHRMASHYAAGVFDDIVAVADVVADEFEDDPEIAADAAAAEIRAAMRLTRRAADSELAMALDVRRRLPRVWAALAAGDIDSRRARLIVHRTTHLRADVAAQVVDRIIDDATDLTTGQLSARLRRLAIEANPSEAKERFECAVEQRRVVTEASVDGTCHLSGFDLPPDGVAAASSHIDGLARQLRGPDEARTMDQLRADVMLDLLSGRVVGERSRRDGSAVSRAAVNITVDLTTLVGLDDNAADLHGYGPVIADIARKVARDEGDAQWRYAVVDEHSGRVYTGVTRRRPTAEVNRQVVARHRRCVFLGCRMPAQDVDLDHRVEWSRGGPTTVDNLAPLCRHDHRVRHEAGWLYRVDADGAVTWTTRLGHIYRTGPDPP